MNAVIQTIDDLCVIEDILTCASLAISQSGGDASSAIAGTVVDAVNRIEAARKRLGEMRDEMMKGAK